jgi:hypothetical protein
MAVPNYARDNRLPQNDSATSSPRRGPRAISSIVWIKDQ